MSQVWIGVAVAAIVALAVALKWRRPPSGRHSAELDVGSVSEGWLSEHRGRKDS